MPIVKDYYTLVAHSGLSNAVELRALNSEAEIRKVMDAGGLVLKSYSEASKVEYRYNYDEASEGSMYPNARALGSFGAELGYKEPIFVPKI